MNPRKGLVLDANILIRAVLGRRVRELLETYEDVRGADAHCASGTGRSACTTGQDRRRWQLRQGGVRL